MYVQKVLFINILMINFLLEINEKTFANGINGKFPFSKDLNNIQIFFHLENTDLNKDSYFINNKTSKNFLKNNFLEKQNFQDFNKQKRILINKPTSLMNEYKSIFKDISNTFLSPYGGHVPRAPDESLEACNTKECYE